MNRKSLLFVLCTMTLGVPTLQHARGTSIDVFNETDYAIKVTIISSNTDVTGSSTLRPHSNLSDFQYENFIMPSLAPYKFTVHIIVDKQFAKCFIFEIPSLAHMEGPIIRVTERPTGSDNFQVSYSSEEAARASKRALAVMEATHKRIGTRAPDLGGVETYKHIAKYILKEPWQQAKLIERAY